MAILQLSKLSSRAVYLLVTGPACSVLPHYADRVNCAGRHHGSKKTLTRGRPLNGVRHHLESSQPMLFSYSCANLGAQAVPVNTWTQFEVGSWYR
ncbi:hypothetical protein GGR56DRAFT_661649 [Xylariaceae sp. FL0804]|nr:hypothetical protein GGR56DRAFT_661649 [Xylariaceae sp. FL0804]